MYYNTTASTKDGPVTHSTWDLSIRRVCNNSKNNNNNSKNNNTNSVIIYPEPYYNYIHIPIVKNMRKLGCGVNILLSPLSVRSRFPLGSNREFNLSKTLAAHRFTLSTSSHWPCCTARTIMPSTHSNPPLRNNINNNKLRTFSSKYTWAEFWMKVTISLKVRIRVKVWVNVKIIRLG